MRDRHVPDYRDLAIEDLARELLVREGDVVAYRELLQMALGQLHIAHAEMARLREQKHRLLDENRALRIQVLRGAAA